MKSTLRDYQIETDRKLRSAYMAGHKRIMVQSPTGSGKTKLAAHLVTNALGKDKRIAFLVPYISLIDQTCYSFMDEGIENFGVIQASHPWEDASAPLQICSIDSLARRKIYPVMDVVIIDEAHRNSTYVHKWMAKGAVFIGLSATPWTKGLGKYYDHLIIASTTQELIRRGYLSPFKVFAPSAPDLEKLETSAGDYNQKKLAKRVDKPKLIASVVETWLEKGRGLGTICYAVNCLHAQHLQEEFQRQGVNCAYIDAYTELREREQVRELFHEGKIEVVCNVGTLTTGVDWDVRCIILARPTKSEMLFTQMIGRGLRTAEGKEDCLILDHSDTHNRLGFVTDIHHNSMDSGAEKAKAQKSEPTPKICPQCQYVKPLKTPICPNCQFESEPHNTVTATKGELVEITGKKTFTTKEGEEIWGMLNWYAMEKGYQSGWAYHTCVEMIGRKPRNEGPRVPPNQSVMKFITYKNIRRSKARLSARKAS